MNPVHVEKVVREALTHAEAANLPMTKRIEHAVRAVLQAFPRMSEQDAIVAVRRIRDKAAA